MPRPRGVKLNKSSPKYLADKKKREEKKLQKAEEGTLVLPSDKKSPIKIQDETNSLADALIKDS